MNKMRQMYPFLKQDVVITSYGETSKISSFSKRFSKFDVNKDATKLLRLCNGARQLNEIFFKILNRAPDEKEIANIESFLQQLNEKKIVQFGNRCLERPVNIRGSIDLIYPQVVSLELTNKCNFHCRYCYQNSSQKKNKFLENPIEIIKYLKTKNVIGFELTGGEPLLHPQFCEIVSFILANFSLLAIISNGSLLKEKHIELLDSTICRVALQVCLDGNTSDMVEETTGVKGSFEMEKNAIKLIKRYGKLLRVGMVVDSPKKIDVIEDTLLLAKELGADSFIANPTINFGRGERIPSTFSVADHLRLNNTITEMSEKYKGFFSKEMEYLDFDFDLLPNCGGGHRNITVNWDGIMKPCPMVSADDLQIGHWSTLSYKSTQKKFKAYSELMSPKKNVCGDCSYFPYCWNCITRALRASKMNPNCVWSRKNRNLIEKITND